MASKMQANEQEKKAREAREANKLVRAVMRASNRIQATGLEVLRDTVDLLRFKSPALSKYEGLIVKKVTDEEAGTQVMPNTLLFYYGNCSREVTRGLVSVYVVDNGERVGMSFLSGTMKHNGAEITVLAINENGEAHLNLDIQRGRHSCDALFIYGTVEGRGYGEVKHNANYCPECEKIIKEFASSG